MLNTLKKLCLLNGVTSGEDTVREFIIGQIRPYIDEIRVDDLGNLIAFKKGKKRTPRLMLAAHMDEVGFIVEKIEEGGYIRFLPIGGIDPRVCLGHKVLIGPKQIPGIIGLKAVHLVKTEERSQVPQFPQMYIDIGAEDKAEASKLVGIGDLITFGSEYYEFGDGMIKAKALDDRIGCAILIDLIKEELPIDVTFVFSAMEETGGGVRAAAYSVAPDIALIFEATGSCDLSNVQGQKKGSIIGGGPVVYNREHKAIYDKKLFDELLELAKENGIPCQTKRMNSGGTDASKIQASRGGVRVAAIAPPIRYSHAASSVVKRTDIVNCEKLGRLFIEAVAAGKAGK